MKEKVLVGMSGGVDSSVAAKILIDRGYEVIGVTIKMYSSDQSYENAVKDARSVADRLGILHYEADFSSDFKRCVIDDFIESYLNGRTPNPCIQCNKFIKFGRMIDMANELGCSKVATGHYAEIKFDKNTGKYYLMRSKDYSKDQTYFLYSLTQKQLSRSLFPLYDTDKTTVRKIAENIGLKIYDKPDSQDICFIKNCHYTDFIKNLTGIISEHGNFIDKDGNILGEHSGIINYTIGQRKGLGITFNKPMYVINKDHLNNTVTLGEESDLYFKGLIADNVNISAFEKLEDPMEITVKIRHSFVEKPAILTLMENGYAQVDFIEKQRAVTAGQAAVFYKDDICIGGGRIVRSL